MRPHGARRNPSARRAAAGLLPPWMSSLRSSPRAIVDLARDFSSRGVSVRAVEPARPCVESRLQELPVKLTRDGAFCLAAALVTAGQPLERGLVLCEELGFPG